MPPLERRRARGERDTACFFTRQIEECETWRELVTDLCASQRVGWRPFLDHLVTSKEHLRLATIKATPWHMGLPGPQLVAIAEMLWADLGRGMDRTQKRARTRVAGEAPSGVEPLATCFLAALQRRRHLREHGCKLFRVVSTVC